METNTKLTKAYSIEAVQWIDLNDQNIVQFLDLCICHNSGVIKHMMVELELHYTQ